MLVSQRLTVKNSTSHPQLWAGQRFPTSGAFTAGSSKVAKRLAPVARVKPKRLKKAPGNFANDHFKKSK